MGCNEPTYKCTCTYTLCIYMYVYTVHLKCACITYGLEVSWRSITTHTLSSQKVKGIVPEEDEIMPLNETPPSLMDYVLPNMTYDSGLNLLLCNEQVPFLLQRKPDEKTSKSTRHFGEGAFRSVHSLLILCVISLPTHKIFT